MKKLMILGAALAVLAGCSSEEELIESGNGKEIKLRSGISAVETKALQENGTAVEEITFLRYDAANQAAISYGTPEVISGVKLADDQNIDFGSNTQYYKASDNAFFIGYYPSPTSASSDNKATLTIDGQTDILATEVFDAGTRLNPSTQSIIFKHLLSQVDVQVKAASEADVTYFGNIESISVTGQSGQATLTCEATPKLETSGSAEISVSTTSTALTTTAASIGTVLLAPQKGSTNVDKNEYQLSLKIKTANTAEQTVTVVLSSADTSNDAMPAGKKSTITLTFSQKAISGKGSIEGWGDGNSGSSDVY